MELAGELLCVSVANGKLSRMYDQILLPYDGSDGAAAVLQHVGTLAEWADATVDVLYVADTNRDSVTVLEDRVVDALVREGKEVVSEATDILAAMGVDADAHVVQGDPAPGIVEFADAHDYDLLVMPTHGRTGVSRYLLGSVTEKVVRLASTPVLTAHIDVAEDWSFPYDAVLIPTDGSAAATAAADHGLRLAADLDATAHLLTVVEADTLGLDVRSSIDSQDREAAAADALDELRDRAAELGVADTTTAVEQGKPARAIQAYVDSQAIDAVVMGTTGRRGTDRILLGSVAEKTVRTASVPVITLQGP